MGYRIDYYNYIASPDWQRKRAARLELDGHCCRLCDEDGTRYRLEVHHRPSSYDKIPNESVFYDLVTVCARCHDLITTVIRSDKYTRRGLPVPDVIASSALSRKEIGNGMAGSEVPIDFILPADTTQRADSRPVEQVVKIIETDYIQKEENRRRL